MNTKLLLQPSLTSRLLSLGKSIIQLEPDQPETDAFIDGMQAGYLASMISWRGVQVMDIELVLLVVRHAHRLCDQDYFCCGYLVGRLVTLVRHGSVEMTSPMFATGYRQGQEAACAYYQRVFPLKDLCTLLSERHGLASEQHTGCLYGFIERLTNGIRTVRPIIPGEGH